MSELTAGKGREMAEWTAGDTEPHLPSSGTVNQSSLSSVAYGRSCAVQATPFSSSFTPPVCQSCVHSDDWEVFHAWDIYSFYIRISDSCWNIVLPKRYMHTNKISACLMLII